jgi:5-methyltetrahydrofolate--homocysteine methyltransferase
MSVKDIFQDVVTFNLTAVVEETKKEIKAGTSVETILNDGLISAMDEVGRLFSEGELFVPEMLRSAKTMKASMEILKPYLAAGATTSRGTVVIGTVKGDMHDIGKNLVAMMLEGGGFTVIDLGVDVETEKFITAAKENGANVVALSALLTTTMPAMEAAIQAIKQAGLSVGTMVGGAPVTQNFAQKIGADGFSDNAPGAVETARRLVAG